MKNHKISTLSAFIAATPGPVAVAVSGGVDSSFLLKLTLEALGPEGVVPVFMDSPFCSETDRMWVKAIGRQLGVKIVVIDWDPLDYLEIRANTALRCYWCKLRMYTILKEKMEKFRVRNVFDGTQADDLNRDRPGLKAIKKLNVLTPMADFSLTKAEIRCESNKYKLINANRPSEACLATEVAPDKMLTIHGLKMVERGRINWNGAVGAVQPAKTPQTMPHPSSKLVINTRLGRAR